MSRNKHTPCFIPDKAEMDNPANLRSHLESKMKKYRPWHVILLGKAHWIGFSTLVAHVNKIYHVQGLERNCYILRNIFTLWILSNRLDLIEFIIRRFIYVYCVSSRWKFYDNLVQWNRNYTPERPGITSLVSDKLQIYFERRSRLILKSSDFIYTYQHWPQIMTSRV
jgi:hypothetical protein